MEYQEDTHNLSRIAYKSGNEKLEGLVHIPEGNGPFPGLVFVHGHNSSCWASSTLGHFLATQYGFTLFATSMLGYGFSSGTSDFNGHRTVQGVIDGIEIFREKDFVNEQTVGIWGVSRGATVAVLIATKKPDWFSAAVFQAGPYEMKSKYRTTKEGIKENMREQIGELSDENFRARSPLYDMENLSCPALVLHGEDDENVPVAQAEMLDKKLTKLKKPHETIILPNTKHRIPIKDRKKYILPFLQKHLT